MCMLVFLLFWPDRLKSGSSEGVLACRPGISVTLGNNLACQKQRERHELKFQTGKNNFGKTIQSSPAFLLVGADECVIALMIRRHHLCNV